MGLGVRLGHTIWVLDQGFHMIPLHGLGGICTFGFLDWVWIEYYAAFTLIS
jgi:hypothetical protein